MYHTRKCDKGDFHENFKVIDMVQIAIVIALYVIIITVVLGPLGSGAIKEFRLSELFNFRLLQ